VRKNDIGTYIENIIMDLLYKHNIILYTSNYNTIMLINYLKFKFRNGFCFKLYYEVSVWITIKLKGI